MSPPLDSAAALDRLDVPEVASVYLFGSQARGTVHADSDVDLALLFDCGALPTADARRRRADAIRTDLMEALHAPRVDLVTLNDAPPELAKTVVHTGRRIACGNPEADHDFCRDAQLRYADLKPFLDRTRRLKLAALRR